ncbi:MAG: hypothetical protein GWN07_40955, partial [Actinobacteria bacterium]|nr:hypothetical protein [Actinomycetota bacterium]NIS37381.1 hypothetical protein [Actinomycetota bacterium]NIU71812.1 hypothetical protein [Actinomycetota bacterium]NIV91079.1 hypothetical protein [Actinomycetota bacterium]NIW33757.1 hypothetical protein [Actinomycetota bacterium]
TLTGSAGGETVYTAALSETGSGHALTFDLQGGIDHDGGATGDVRALPIDLTVTDTNGLSDNGTATVSVVDDAPVTVSGSLVSQAEGGAAV